MLNLEFNRPVTKFEKIVYTFGILFLLLYLIPIAFGINPIEWAKQNITWDNISDGITNIGMIILVNIPTYIFEFINIGFQYLKHLDYDNLNGFESFLGLLGMLIIGIFSIWVFIFYYGTLLMIIGMFFISLFQGRNLYKTASLSNIIVTPRTIYGKNFNNVIMGRVTVNELQKYEAQANEFKRVLEESDSKIIKEIFKNL